MKWLEASEKELKKDVKYEQEALQKNESSVWKFPKKAKGQALDRKLLKAAPTKHYSPLGSLPVASFLVCKGFAEVLGNLIVILHRGFSTKRKEPKQLVTE